MNIAKVERVERSGPERMSPEQAEERGLVPRQNGDTGRPLLWVPEGTKRMYYSRPSGLGSELDGKEQLMAWEGRMVLDGIHRVPALLDEYREILAMKDFDPKGQPFKSKIQALVDRAKVIANAKSKADIGTALHAITEDIDHGRDPGFIPPVFEPLIDAYVEAMELARQRYGMVVLDTEVFVANDTWHTAGTLDKLLLFEDQLVIGDSKTSGTLAWSRGKFAMQIASYAAGLRYDPRLALIKANEFGLGVGRAPLQVGREVNREFGIIVHFPSDGYQCDIVKIPLGQASVGWAARNAVREWRNYWNRKANRFDEHPLVSVTKEVA